MIKSYFRIAFRNLVRNRSYSLINITGLTIGLTSCLLIFLYIQDELSFDRFHEKSDRIFRVVQSTDLSGSASIPARWAGRLSEFPEVEARVRVDQTDGVVMIEGRDPVRETGIMYVDDTFFEVFSYPLEQGNPATVLSEPRSIVLTPETARRYFGERNPVGETIKFRDGEEFTVKGVTGEIPGNSHLQFDMLVSYSTRSGYSGFDHQGFAYVLLHDAAGVSSLLSRLDTILSGSDEEILQHFGFHIKGMAYDLQPVEEIHLYPALDGAIQAQSDIRYIYIFGAVGIFVLGIACINYINLATARSVRRSREVGLRKVAGAGRIQLVGQFLGESICFTAIAFLLALGLADLLAPLFNSLTGKDLSLFSLAGGFEGVVLVLALLVTGGLSGLYPAIMVSSHNPARILISRGGSSGEAGGKGLRQGLVAFQFVISIVLIASTLVVQSQLDYIQEKRLGYDAEQVLTLPVVSSLDVTPGESADARTGTVRQELEAVAGVESVSLAFGAPTGYLTSNFEYGGQSVRITQLPVDFGYVKTMGMELVEGRDFSREYATDDERGIIVNETAARMFDLEGKVGETLDFDLGGQDPILVGIVKDFHTATLHHEIRPTVLRIMPFLHRSYIVRLTPGSLPEVLDRLEQAWSHFGFNYPFDYRFVDDTVQNLYTSERRLSWIFQGFALLAMVIACMGLVGLSAYTAERRTREIGIRKVLGATVTGIVGLLSRDFMRLVILGFLIAVPITWYIMNRWLSDFAYRIEIGPRIFLLAGGAALLVAMVTVSWQSVRAALANPVDSLRSE